MEDSVYREIGDIRSGKSGGKWREDVRQQVRCQQNELAKWTLGVQFGNVLSMIESKLLEEEKISSAISLIIL